MTSLDEHFEQLSPLLDDVISRIGELKLCPYKTATLSAWAMTRIALGTAIDMADSQIDDEQMSAEERQQLLELLADNMRKFDAALMAALERHGEALQ
jgi:hypothetical protein